ncbi:MAG: ABC transporter [Candidatus Accumulibacter sp. 66-26]|nr:ABC transporter ATP-binding protein [Accumulibacter sp.]OJW48005.1 MAG: ABC transporter [Candidatus Accumulibacter sp. 66-26]
MSVVRIEHVYKDYLLGEQKVQALKDITLSFEPGVFLAIAGPSGSGKTTLLNLIGCIDTPTRGKIYINDQDVSGRTPDQLADLRAHTIGFIFQTFNLLPVLSAAENVEYPLLQRKDLSREERQKRVAYFLDIVGLTKFASHRPNQLSGGQRQRVAIARALAIRPAIVLADEPTANLDHKTGEEILNLMKQINRTFHTTFIFSTHDKRVIAKADRLVRVEDGEISALGVRADAKWSLARQRRASDGALRFKVTPPG